VTASKEKTVSINHTARGLRHIAVTAIAAGAIAIGAGVATLNAVALADVATATNNSVKSEPGSTPGSGATGTLSIAVTAKWNHAAQQISNSKREYLVFNDDRQDSGNKNQPGSGDK
jgi:hypothetical protein